ncbi:MAG: diaminopimelate epimerase [Acidobacteria bacterium]|nr:MAG: diaminopimelate epimerase [Acidobacteriota bacterium]PYR48718.1 MAG: diaminopimelate epimerase [Acidobacteriota bacterium]
MIGFAKAHAYGNDFLYVRGAEVAGVRLDGLAREMCDRQTGIGADGLIVYETTPGGAAMRLFNADGGSAEISGNGVRGLAALLALHDDHLSLNLTVATAGGIKQLTRLARDATRQTFRAEMGAPEGLRQASIALAGETVDLVLLSMGNPQAVLLGPLPSDDRFRFLGSALERHPAFPEGTNVGFAYVKEPAVVHVRIWERGVGPTLSSGTGSCAALVAAAAYGGAARKAEVIAPGGGQLVEWTETGVYLTGWAEVLCQGEWLRAPPISAATAFPSGS